MYNFGGVVLPPNPEFFEFGRILVIGQTIFDI